MKPSTQRIPLYRDINDFLASIPSPYRSPNPDFFCLRLRPFDASMNHYKPPFRKDFYFIALVTHAGKTRITYDNTQVSSLNAFLVFQTPGLIYSFHRDESAEGYLVYFKPACLSFFRPGIEKAFPFFDILHTNFFQFDQDRYQQLSPVFEHLFTAYEENRDGMYEKASARLLSLLYELKDFSRENRQWEEGFNGPQQNLLHTFTQLVNTHYIEHRSVDEYANMLHVTANHLSKAVRQASGKTALSFINERILSEARSLIRFTDSDIASIAYQLNFSDPANFGRFFRKHTGMTPLEFRKMHAPD